MPETPHERAMCLGGVLDHGHAEFEQRPDWRRPAVEVDDDDCRASGP